MTSSPSNDYFDLALAPHPVIGIFRGANPDQTVRLAHDAWDSGVRLVEIPVQTPDAVPSLEAAIAAGRDRGAPVGAGTVTTGAQLEQVLARGADFIVSPGLHPDVVRGCRQRGVPLLPGVATSTEIAAALAEGLTWLKAFPAAQLGPEWIKAQAGPFPDVRFVATGGIGPANAAAFLEAGCRAVAVGSAFATPEGIRSLADALAAHRTPAAKDS